MSSAKGQSDGIGQAALGTACGGLRAQQLQGCVCAGSFGLRGVTHRGPAGAAARLRHTPAGLRRRHAGSQRRLQLAGAEQAVAGLFDRAHQGFANQISSSVTSAR
jgi:hypothetical protein